MARAGSATCVSSGFLKSLMVHDERATVLAHSQWPPEACHKRYVAHVLSRQTGWVDFAVFDAVERCFHDRGVDKPNGIVVTRGAVKGTGQRQVLDAWSSRHEDGEQPEGAKLLQYAEEDVESPDLLVWIWKRRNQPVS